jgi:endonuclease-8
MPEGPSIVLLKESVKSFKGLRVSKAAGDLKDFNYKRINGQKITRFKTWGKHFLICFEEFTIRIHLLMFGSCMINEHKDARARLSLKFENDTELNFYTCSVKFIDEPLNQVYDWTADVMNKKWDTYSALEKLHLKPTALVCDALLDQTIFSGVGNIIKNEVLFRIRVHPESILGKLPRAKKRELVNECVKYSFEFLRERRNSTLTKYWLAHTKKICPRDNNRFHKEYLGKTKRRSFFCTKCQKRYV